MSNTILENSNAAYDPLAHNDISSSFFPDRLQQEMQSSSVTLNGRLWEQALAKIKSANFSQALYRDLSKTTVKTQFEAYAKAFSVSTVTEILARGG